MSAAGPPSPEQLAALAKGEKEGQAVVLWTVGMFCIFGWDYFMNLPKEIERIWKKNFSYISGLYVLNRYYGLIQFAVCIVLITTPITNAISVDACQKIFLWQPVGALISTFLSQAIMGSRVYALYGRSNIILGILGAIVLAEFIVHAYTMTLVFPAPSPAPGVVLPCVAIGPTNWLITFWVVPLVFDTVTFSMTLYKSIEHWRNQVVSSTLAMLFRDGLVYFAAIFSMNLINVILFVTQSPTLQAVNLPATLMLNIIMSCKLVLNLQLAQGQKDGQAVVLWTVGMFCIFGWDYLVNLPQEIERIWRRKISYVSVLYLINRYYGLLQFSLVVALITTPITNAFSTESCKKIFLWQPVGALISIFISQAIMGSRVYALYGKSMVIAGCLSVIMAAEFIVHVYTLTRVFPAPEPAPGVPIPCVAIGPTRWLVSFWAIPLLYDTITFLLTLYETVGYWRSRSDSPILVVLFRDGLAYFAAIFSMNLVNVILFVTQNTTLQAANLPATLMLNVLMSCRLVLNLRASPTVVSSDGAPLVTESEPKLETWRAHERTQTTSTGFLNTYFSRRETASTTLNTQSILPL
ncbi:hypothetical protein D9615_000702 [Tricholomella constricta]|uniref:DUF6533 domain-containing protein n=1 Tax=Tricholomella constricta TaxID=117010 RepID=A0A8H5HRT5_9AGAR|nr:hypothetical protein D9615_000702 [Tricholomella constricta]